MKLDWDLLRLQVRGQVRPVHAHEEGVQSAVMGWAGHHIFVANDEIGVQRIPMDKLIPGEFRGGVLDIGLVLLDVREAKIA